jgi:hypothetical protein
MTDPTSPRYVRPSWLTTHVFNKLVVAPTRIGLSVWGSRILEVKGRTSGEPRRTPVNLLTLEGVRYLVAPRGETQLVRNLRVANGGVLILGRRREAFRTTEVPIADRAPILRAYLKRWKAEVGVFFDGVGPDASDEALIEVAPKHPVFRITA